MGKESERASDTTAKEKKPSGADERSSSSLPLASSSPSLLATRGTFASKCSSSSSQRSLWRPLAAVICLWHFY